MSQAGTPAPGSSIARTAAPRVQFWEVPFVYEMDFANIANGASQNGAIQIQADSDFRWDKATYFADIAGAVQTESSQVIPLCTLQIQDTGTGRQLFQAPIQVSNFFGRGILPFILPTPYIFKARSSLAFTLANYSAGTTYANVRLSLIGTKIFAGSPQG